MRDLGITVDTPICTGCRLCEIACSLFHRHAINPEGARIRVIDKWEQSLYEPHICQLCRPAPCVESCPFEALTQQQHSGVIKVNPELCSNCGACVAACPHQAIRWSDSLSELLVCDRCDGEPSCVPFCHRGALKMNPSPGQDQ